MNKLFKAVIIALTFSVVLFPGCKKNKAPDKPSTPAGLTIGSINTQYTFTSSADDPDEDSIAIRFDWGDEDTSNWSAFVASGDSISESHTWSDSGTYSIKVQAEDLKEAVSSWSSGHQIIISPSIPPNTPATPIGDSIGLVNVSYSFVSTASDPDGDSVAMRFMWGDGDTSNWSDFVPCGDSISMSHAWSDSGTYSIKAQAKDLYEGISSWSGGHQIIIGSTIPNNPPNTPTTPVGDSIGLVNFSYTFISTATDPNGDSIAIRLDWGNGERSDWSDWQASGDSIVMSYIWSDSGTYEIRSQAKDKKDAISAWSAVHTIKISAGWEKTFGDTAHNDEGRSVQQTSDGGYIITGFTNSYGAGGYDVYLIKTDSLGNQMWYKTFGGTGDDYGYSVDITSDGGYIITGRTNSFGGMSQVYLIKTYANGNEEWHQTKGYSDRDDWGNSVQQTSDGGYIIVGRTRESGSEAVYLIKTDANGNNQWYDLKGYDAYDDEGYDVQQTSDGGYILVGKTNESGSGDVFLIKTNATGGGGWNNHIGGTSADYGLSVQQISSGYIITGWTRSYGQGESDVYLIKTDGSGNQAWYKTFGGTNDDVGYEVQPTSDGGYIITGNKASDVYLIKTDGSGNETWSKTFGGEGYDVGRSVQQTRDGGYIITGNKAGDVYLIKTDANGNVK